MAESGGPDPKDAYAKLVQAYKSRPVYRWDPRKIGPLPGGSQSIAVLLQWHANAQSLCGLAIRYSKTPFFVVTVGFIGAVMSWMKLNDKTKLEVKNEDLRKKLETKEAERKTQANTAKEALQLEIDKLTQEKEKNEALRKRLDAQEIELTAQAKSAKQAMQSEVDELIKENQRLKGERGIYYQFKDWWQ